jgi:hypothetical protein
VLERYAHSCKRLHRDHPALADSTQDVRAVAVHTKRGGERCPVESDFNVTGMVYIGTITRNCIVIKRYSEVLRMASYSPRTE